MMKSYLRRGFYWAALGVGGLAIAQPASAGFNTYTDRTAYELAAVAGGASLLTENFNGFIADASFKIADGPVIAGPLTFSELGPTTAFDSANRIDVSSFVFPTLAPNTTTFALVTASLNSSSVPDNAVQILFSSPVSAFGANFRRTASTEHEQTQFTLIGTPSTVIPMPDETTGVTTFFGFVANAGETFTGVRVDAQLFIDSRREIFGMDDVTLAIVPEPGSAALLALGSLRLMRRRSR